MRYACPKALTTLCVSLHAQNFETLLRWVKQCSSLQDLEFCIVDADPTDFVVELTSLVLHLDDLTTLRFTQENLTKADMWEAENDRCRTGLEELATRLLHFLDTLPPTLVEREAAFWAPAGECYDLLKTFLRSRSHDPPLKRVIFDAEVKKFGRVQLEATRSQELAEDSGEVTWCLSYKHWEGCSCGDWGYGSWTLDGPDAAEYEVSDPSVELKW